MPSPPQELTLDTPIGEILASLYDFSDELLDPAKAPRLLLDSNRLQVNWQLSGIPEPAAASIVEVSFSARPVAPATIQIKQPAVAAAPALDSLSPTSVPAGADATLDLIGTGFSGGATVNIGNAYGLVPSSFSPTNLNVLVRSSNIALAGTLAVSVSNLDRQVSNSLNLTLT